jgi:hypothetical protein
MFLNIISCVILRNLKLDTINPRDMKKYKIRLEAHVTGTGSIVPFSIKIFKAASNRKLKVKPTSKSTAASTGILVLTF